PHFFTLHEKFEELYDDNEKWFDRLAEQLLASGYKPASTTKELTEFSMLSEDPADKYIKAEEMVDNIINNFRETSKLTIRAIHLAAEAENVVFEDTIIEFKDNLDTKIWMLQAFLGKEALEDDDYYDEEED